MTILVHISDKMKICYINFHFSLFISEAMDPSFLLKFKVLFEKTLNFVIK